MTEDDYNKWQELEQRLSRMLYYLDEAVTTEEQEKPEFEAILKEMIDRGGEFAVLARDMMRGNDYTLPD